MHVHWVTLCEQCSVLLGICMQVSGLQGERIPGLTGVWVGGSKVAAIGVRAKR